VTAEWKAAAHAGNVEAMEQLLETGADIDAKDQHGQTALMLAALRGHTAGVRFLASRGAGLDHTAKFHLTALMLAVVGGHADIVRALAEAGADLTVRGTGGPGFHDKTALDLAEARVGDEAVMRVRDEMTRALRAASAMEDGPA
jgi:ankyrin repeat protein